MKIFALGPEGSYGHEATLIATQKLNLRNAELIFQPANTAILPAVERQGGIGIVPVENSTYGDVVEVLGYLAKQSPEYPLRIIGEVELSVQHCLLSPPALKRIAELKGIVSHPQAVGQCQESIQRWGIQHLEPATSTSAAAKYVAENPQKKFGALASRFAAATYGLTILAGDVQTYRDNATRFFMFGRAETSAATGHDKTVLIFHVQNEAGALGKVLAPFAKHAINLTAIHSVPVGAWHYGFYMETNLHQSDKRMKAALSEVHPWVNLLFVLGSFPR